MITHEQTLFFHVSQLAFFVPFFEFYTSDLFGFTFYQYVISIGAWSKIGIDNIFIENFNIDVLSQIQ